MHVSNTPASVFDTFHPLGLVMIHDKRADPLTPPFGYLYAPPHLPSSWYVDTPGIFLFLGRKQGKRRGEMGVVGPPSRSNKNQLQKRCVNEAKNPFICSWIQCELQASRLGIIKLMFVAFARNCWISVPLYSHFIELWEIDWRGRDGYPNAGLFGWKLATGRYGGTEFCTKSISDSNIILKNLVAQSSTTNARWLASKNASLSSVDLPAKIPLYSLQYKHYEWRYQYHEWKLHDGWVRNKSRVLVK